MQANGQIRQMVKRKNIVEFLHQIFDADILKDYNFINDQYDECKIFIFSNGYYSQLKYETSGDKAGTFAAILFGIIAFGSPIFLLILSHSIKSNANNKDYVKRLSSLADRLKTDKTITIIANTVELFRLLISALILVFLRYVPAIQIILLHILTFAK